ncbi:AarF/ABC1/UbiB kinase family protein [Paenibacillus sp. S3N08]|uniref:AarF/ABC1/UbiB kinase family protein n=2 Tax=Paenibacillus agricola TaxID=2716264 RepID=A0ABX0JFT3_9BACL|nr:AarF/ABC1/UbiB kinase family protein [Paenibacillus agricola]
MMIKIRHTKRYREIAVALVRHGFGYMVEELGLFHLLTFPRLGLRRREHAAASAKTMEVRIRLVLEQLGPTFIKLGQLTSTRNDLLSKELIHELEKLQDQVPPFSSEQARAILQEELHKPIEEVLMEFDDQPIAAASIGQVHFGRLLTGEAVAIKIQRPFVKEMVNRDLEILADLAELAERRLDWVSRYRIREMIEEFSRSLKEELNYVTEGKNADSIARQFIRQSTVIIPKVYWKHTTSKVLIMEYVEGIKLNQSEELTAQGYDRELIAKQFVNAMMHQILIEGLFHADPHPGNVFVLPEGRLAFVDFGMVGRLDPDMKYHLSSLIIAIMRKNTDSIIRSILRLGLVSEEVDMTTLRRDLNQLREQYYDVPFAQVSLGKALNELLIIANRHHILVPTDLTLLGKALLTIEGVTEKLYPEGRLIDMAEPFGRKLVKDRMSSGQIPKRFWRNLIELGDTFLELPKQANQLTRMIRTGKLRMEIGLSEIDLLMRKLDQVSNRISFSIVLLSFSIIMVGLILAAALGNEKLFLWHIPVIEIGSVVASLMVIYLLYSIIKSGRI